jgi:hypothetical protein
MKFSRASVIAYFLHLFTLPTVKKEIEKYANLFLGEASRFSSGMKGEATETKESFLILAKYLKKEKLTGAEKKRFKKQTLNILKSAGVVVPVMLIPLPFISTLLLIIMDHVLLSMNIQILPSAFYTAEKKDILTIDGIRRDLKRRILRKK